MVVPVRFLAGSGKVVTLATSWYVIWTDNAAVSQRFQVQTYHIISTAKPPAVGSIYAGGTVTSVQGPYTSRKAAESAIGSTTTSGVGEGSGSGVASGNVNIPAPLGGLAAIGDFFQRLTQAHTWERIGEVVLGLILIAVGVAKITNAIPVATKIASVIK
jgi:hypothetical protein